MKLYLEPKIFEIPQTEAYALANSCATEVGAKAIAFNHIPLKALLREQMQEWVGPFSGWEKTYEQNGGAEIGTEVVLTHGDSAKTMTLRLISKTRALYAVGVMPIANYDLAASGSPDQPKGFLEETLVECVGEEGLPSVLLQFPSMLEAMLIRAQSERKKDIRKSAAKLTLEDFERGLG